MQKILIIDDEIPILEAAKTILEDMGYSVTTFSNPLEGVDVALETDFDLILTDMRMPQKNGAEVTKEILEKKDNANIMIITAFPGDHIVKEALDYGAKGVVKKPFEIAKILQFLNRS